MKNSFIYKWFDKKNHMYYIGVHKGTPNDGYICSSKLMLEEYKKRPNDFSREILFFGDFDEMIKKETTMLKSLDAARNLKYYNQHNGDGNFYCKQHTAETKNIISNKLKLYKKTKEHCNAISLSKIGKKPAKYNRKSYIGSNNPNFGKKTKPEICDLLHEKFSKKYLIENVLYTGLSEVMEKYNLNSKAVVFYRIKSTSKKFKEWNYAD